MEIPLQKCPDKAAKLSFTIRNVIKEDSSNRPGSQGGFMGGLMADIIKGPKPPLPTLKPSPLVAPNIQIRQMTPTSIPSDNVNKEREALLTENKRMSGLLMEAQAENERMKA